MVITTVGRSINLQVTVWYVRDILNLSSKHSNSCLTGMTENASCFYLAKTLSRLPLPKHTLAHTCWCCATSLIPQRKSKNKNKCAISFDSSILTEEMGYIAGFNTVFFRKNWQSDRHIHNRNIPWGRDGLMELSDLVVLHVWPFQRRRLCAVKCRLCRTENYLHRDSNPRPLDIKSEALTGRRLHETYASLVNKNATITSRNTSTVGIIAVTKLIASVSNIPVTQSLY